MIGWFEIQVSDLEQGKQFYGGVFGWTFKNWLDGYEIAHDSADTMVCAIQQVEGEPAGRQFHVVFDVDGLGFTLEEALEKVTDAGGSVKVGRTRIAPDMGWYATVADPSGLSFDFSTMRPSA